MQFVLQQLYLIAIAKKFSVFLTHHFCVYIVRFKDQPQLRIHDFSESSSMFASTFQTIEKLNLKKHGKISSIPIFRPLFGITNSFDDRNFINCLMATYFLKVYNMKRLHFKTYLWLGFKNSKYDTVALECWFIFKQVLLITCTATALKTKIKLNLSVCSNALHKD